MSDTADTIVGIDLGTTFCVVATIDANGRPTSVPNGDGDILTPSVLVLDRTAVIVGKEAVKLAVQEPHNTAEHPKRDMGREAYHQPVRGQRWRPEVLQGAILHHLKRDAEAKLGPLRRCVITVPAYFNEPRRKATQDAGRMAGWEVLDIINEPTAAAISYGMQRGFLNEHTAETILIYDLGGGTFDITLMRITGTEFTTVATAGDVELGGIDWDRRLVEEFAQQFLAEHHIDPRTDPVHHARLRAEAESAKRSLTTRSEVTVPFAIEQHRSRLHISRRRFEELTSDLVDRTIFTLQKLLRESKTSTSQITRLLAVGGSTRMPMIGATLERETGLKLDRVLSPDEAVAHGAALYAQQLADPAAQTRFTIRNVNSHALGVLGVDRATGTKKRHIMIARQTPLPAMAVQRFPTFRDNQQQVKVHIVEGGDAAGHGATEIGVCRIRDLPANLPKGEAVDITFAYTPDGRLDVTAKMPRLNKETALVVERATGMPDSELQAWANAIAAGLPAPDEPASSTPTNPEEPLASTPEETPTEDQADLTAFQFWNNPPE